MIGTHSVDSSEAHAGSGSESSDVEVGATDGVGDSSEVESDLKERRNEEEGISFGSNATSENRVERDSPKGCCCKGTGSNLWKGRAAERSSASRRVEKQGKRTEKD